MVSRNRKTLTLGLILVHVATSVTALVGPAELTAQADTTPLVSNATTGYTPFTFTGTPMSFQTSQAQTLSNLYGSCFGTGNNNQTNQLVDSIVKLTTTKTPGATNSGANGSCSVDIKTCSTNVPNVSPSCPEKVELVDALFNKLIQTATDGSCCVKAKMNALEEANKELTCITQQNNLLAQQIKSIQSDMQSKFQQAQKDVGNLDTVIGERVNQQEFIQSKLGGDKSNGTRGLLALQADMQKVVTGELPVKVKTFEDTITSYNQQQQIFQQRVANQKMALAKQCFTSSDSRYQCSVNSTSTCSFAELMEAKYYELMRSVNGKIQRTNKTNQAQAQSKKAALDALFQTIFANMASDTKLVATTQQEAQNQQQTSGDIYQIKSPQDLQNLYGSQLAAFNLPGLNIQQLFLNKFEQCYEQGQSSVTSAQSDPTSQYSLSVTFMQKQNKDIRDGFIQFYKGYADMYAQFWSTMGQTAPLDTSKCEASSTPLAGMLQCAKDLQVNLEGAYTGKTANSAVTITVPGSSVMPGSTTATGTKFNFTCNGVNGCVTVMQNLSTNLKTEIQNQDKAKKNYIQQANQQLDQYKQQLVSILNTQNQALTSRILALKQTMAQGGVQDTLSTQAIQKEKMNKAKTKDAAGNEYDGLYEMPDNLLAVIGGDMSPPLIDPNSPGFDNARMSIAQTISNDRGKDAEFANLAANLQKQEMSCKKELGKGAIEKNKSLIQQLGNACATVDDTGTCTSEQASIVEAGNVLSTQFDGLGLELELSSLQSLGTGIAQDCGKSQKVKKRIDELEKESNDLGCDKNFQTSQKCQTNKTQMDRLQAQLDNMGYSDSKAMCMSLSQSLAKKQLDSSDDGDSSDGPTVKAK